MENEKISLGLPVPWINQEGGGEELIFLPTSTGKFVI
jgi:hypothetical protein